MNRATVNIWLCYLLEQTCIPQINHQNLISTYEYNYIYPIHLKILKQEKAGGGSFIFDT